MSKIPTGIRTEKEYIPYYRYENDTYNGYWTSGSFATLKQAKDFLNSKEGLSEWKIVRVVITHSYNVVTKSK